MSLWREITDIIDAQLSVEKCRFLSDLRRLAFLPAIPFLIAMYFVEAPSTLGAVLIVGLVLAEASWLIFLLRRQAIKRRSWQEPTRFSDENNGY